MIPATSEESAIRPRLTPLYLRSQGSSGCSRLAHAINGLQQAKLLLLNPVTLEEEDLNVAQSSGSGMDRSLLSYQVRIINSRVSPVAIEQVLNACSGSTVTAIARKQSPKGAEFDSNFYLVTFDSENCPLNLVNVTHVAIDAGDFYVHHFQRYVRIPCFACFGIGHTVNQCRALTGVVLHRHHRESKAPFHAITPMTRAEIQLLDYSARRDFVTMEAKQLEAHRQAGAEYEFKPMYVVQKSAQSLSQNTQQAPPKYVATPYQAKSKDAQAHRHGSETPSSPLEAPWITANGRDKTNRRAVRQAVTAPGPTSGPIEASNSGSTHGEAKKAAPAQRSAPTGARDTAALAKKPSNDKTNAAAIL